MLIIILQLMLEIPLITLEFLNHLQWHPCKHFSLFLMTACYLALQCTFKWLHLKNDLSLRRSAKYCVFLQDKNGSQFRWNRKVEVRKCLPGTFKVVPSFKFVLSQMTASKIISEESLCLTKQKKQKNNIKMQVMASLLLCFNQFYMYICIVLSPVNFLLTFISLLF